MSELQSATKKADIHKETIGTRVLSIADFPEQLDAGRKTSVQDFAVWIRALRQNWRQGTVGCKGRSDVAHTNKKPWKQKGTGRARAGSARSPLWRGGGVIFGPQMRTRMLTVTKKQRKGVMRGLLKQSLNDGNVFALSWAPSNDKPSTVNAFNALQASQLGDKPVLLFVRRDDQVTFRSFRNIQNVNIISFDQPNAFHLAVSDRWIVLDKDLEQFRNMVLAWC